MPHVSRAYKLYKWRFVGDSNPSEHGTFSPENSSDEGLKSLAPTKTVARQTPIYHDIHQVAWGSIIKSPETHALCA